MPDVSKEDSLLAICGVETMKHVTVRSDSQSHRLHPQGAILRMESRGAPNSPGAYSRYFGEKAAVIGRGIAPYGFPCYS